MKMWWSSFRYSLPWLRIPCPTISGYLMFSIIFDQAWQNSLCDQHIFLSSNIVTARISFFLGSIAIHHSHISSAESTFIKVSSTMNTTIFLFFWYNILCGQYFSIQSIIASVWLLLTNLNNVLEAFLKYKPSNYRLTAYIISFIGVLCLIW